MLHSRYNDSQVMIPLWDAVNQRPANKIWTVSKTTYDKIFSYFKDQFPASLELRDIDIRVARNESGGMNFELVPAKAEEYKELKNDQS